MSLFIVVAKNTRTGRLLMVDDPDAREGFQEFSAAQERADAATAEEGSGYGWEYVVGRVELVERPSDEEDGE